MLSIKLVPRQWGFEQQDLGTHGLCVQWYRWSVVYTVRNTVLQYTEEGPQEINRLLAPN